MDRPSQSLSVATMLGAFLTMSRYAPPPDLYMPKTRDGFQTKGTSYKPQSGQKYIRRRLRRARSGMNTRNL